MDVDFVLPVPFVVYFVSDSNLPLPLTDIDGGPKHRCAAKHGEHNAKRVMRGDGW